MASKNDEIILGLDLSERSLKLFQRHTVTNEADLVHVEPLSPAEFEAEGYLAAVLKRLVSMYRGHLKAQRIVVSLPSALTFTRVIEADPGSQDLRAQLLWEIEQQSLGRTEPQVFDFLRIPPEAVRSSDTETQLEQLAGDTVDAAELDDSLSSDNPGRLPAQSVSKRAEPAAPSPEYARFLVAAADEPRIKFLETAFKKAKLPLSVVDVDLFALINVFNHNYPEDQSDLAAIADIRADSATVLLTRQGHYLDHEYVRALDFSRSESLAPSIEKIEAVALGQAQSVRGNLKKIMICGEVLADPQLRETLVAAFKESVEVLDPLKKIGVAREIAKQINLISPALAVAAGLTLRTEGEDDGA